MDPAQAQAQMHHMMLTLMPLMFLGGLLFLALLIVPLWRIATKAGLSGPISLLAIIPWLGTLLALYIIAFSEWRVTPTAQLPYPPTPYPPTPYPPAPYPTAGFAPPAPQPQPSSPYPPPPHEPPTV